MGVFDKLIGHVFDLNFNTHKAMIEADFLWNFKEYQLDNGFFKGSLHAIHTSHIQLGYASRSNGILLKGKTPQNAYLFASVVSAEGKITHNGLSIYADELVVLNDRDELDLTVSTAFNDVSIAIDKDFFEAAFKEYFNEPFQYDKVNKRIQLKENMEINFRDSIKKLLYDMMAQNTELIDNAAFHNKSEQAILQIVFQNIDLSKKRKKALASGINANKLRKFIEKHYMSDITVNELSFRKHFSERTIRRRFSHLFGFSPKQYLRCYRLGRVHHTLLETDARSRTVGLIAYDHGFSHMGRFTEDYKVMFGETPSSTLKKILS